MSAERRRISFVVVVPPRALLLDLAGPLEVLRVANAVQDRVLFDVAYVGPRGETLLSIGLGICDVAPPPEAIPAGSILFLPGSAKAALAPWPNAEADDAAMRPARASPRPGTCAGCGNNTIRKRRRRFAPPPGHDRAPA